MGASGPESSSTESAALAAKLEVAESALFADACRGRGCVLHLVSASASASFPLCVPAQLLVLVLALALVLYSTALDPA